MFTCGAACSDCLPQSLMSVLIGWRWSLGWGQEGRNWAVLSHWVSAACNQASRRRRSKDPTHTHTHKMACSVTHPLIFIIAVLEHGEKSGIEVSEKSQTWQEAEKDFVNKHFKGRLEPAEQMRMSNMKRNEVCVCVYISDYEIFACLLNNILPYWYPVR